MSQPTLTQLLAEMSAMGIAWSVSHSEADGMNFHGMAMMRVQTGNSASACFQVDILKDSAAVAEIVKRVAQLDPSAAASLATTEVHIYPSLEDQAHCARCGMECGGVA